MSKTVIEESRYALLSALVAALYPQADTALITRTVRELVVALPLSALLKQSSRHATEDVLP